jgi:GNAT superfamily N-acetyltransferase
MTATAPDEIVIRCQLREGDVDAIADLHRRVYGPEYARNDEFVARVRAGVEAAVAAGWPEAGGGVWLIDRCGELSGCLALTDEGEGVGRLRWFVLERELRGRGLGRALVHELLASAREQGFAQLELETFSALTSAARIYRDAGFQLTWEQERDDWGPPILYQHYVMDLS